MKTEEYLMNIAKQEKQFDALYRNAGTLFGLPDCAMWILYFLSTSEDELSQQDLIEKMMFPKQTINSAAICVWLLGYFFVFLPVRWRMLSDEYGYAAKASFRKSGVRSKQNVFNSSMVMVSL